MTQNFFAITISICAIAIALFASVIAMNKPKIEIIEVVHRCEVSKQDNGYHLDVSGANSKPIKQGKTITSGYLDGSSLDISGTNGIFNAGSIILDSCQLDSLRKIYTSDFKKSETK